MVAIIIGTAVVDGKLVTFIHPYCPNCHNGATTPQDTQGRNWKCIDCQTVFRHEDRYIPPELKK